jgi:hypothetical protein
VRALWATWIHSLRISAPADSFPPDSLIPSRVLTAAALARIGPMRGVFAPIWAACPAFGGGDRARLPTDAHVEGQFCARDYHLTKG